MNRVLQTRELAWLLSSLLWAFLGCDTEMTPGSDEPSSSNETAPSSTSDDAGAETEAEMSELATLCGEGPDLVGDFSLPEDAAVNVLDYGARGDGSNDDTDAIQAAIDDTYSAWEQVYLPAGTYLISKRIDVGRFITVRGAGPGKTIIKLKDNAADYQDAEDPASVLRAWRGCCAEEDNDNTTHSMHFLNFTLDVGAGNPGAIGFDFIAHNGGGIENVVVRAAKDSGHTGIWMGRNSPGPHLLNRIRVTGFDTGVYVRWGGYGTTIEELFLEDQRSVGVLNAQHPLSMRCVMSQNSVPAVENESDAFGLLVLMDSVLEGGDPATPAVRSIGSHYLRNVRVDGYGTSVEGGDSSTAEALIEESIEPEITTFRDSLKRSLRMKVPAMFQPEYEDAASWVSVGDFADLREGEDWAPAIQAAIDSGASTIYFPNSTHAPYPIEQDIFIRGKVRYVIGLSARFGGNNPGNVVIVTEDPNATVFFEQIRADNTIVQESPATVVIRRSIGGTLKVEPNTGPVHLDDWCCGNIEIDGGQVFARQLNEESDGEKLFVTEGSLFILGLKTELLGTVGRFSNGARTEILGGLIYPTQGTPTVPMYINENSSFSAIHRELAGPYPVFVRETHEGDTSEPEVPFTGGSNYVSDLYSSEE